jgi:hypothetical protein
VWESWELTSREVIFSLLNKRQTTIINIYPNFGPSAAINVVGNVLFSRRETLANRNS